MGAVGGAVSRHSIGCTPLVPRRREGDQSPHANRGAGLVFGNFAIATAERIGASLAQEFLFGKFTRRGGHMK
jgi:hypothetical protein